MLQPAQLKHLSTVQWTGSNLAHHPGNCRPSCCPHHRRKHLDDPGYRNRGSLEVGGSGGVSALVGPSTDEKWSLILKHQENVTLTGAGSRAGIRGYEDIRLHSSSAAMVVKFSQDTCTV